LEKEKEFSILFLAVGRNPAGNRVRPSQPFPSPTPTQPSAAQPNLACPLHAAIKQWHVPQNVKQHRRFWGLVGYYRKFVKHFGIIAKPLTELLKKHVQFQWTGLHQKELLTLKQALIAGPVLALLDFSK
jgi:hypothetical protein